MRAKRCGTVAGKVRARRALHASRRHAAKSRPTAAFRRQAPASRLQPRSRRGRSGNRPHCALDRVAAGDASGSFMSVIRAGGLQAGAVGDLDQRAGEVSRPRDRS